MKLKISVALLMALAPALALAKPSSVHMHPQLFHDRAPKARTHDAKLHEVHVRPQKSPPPPVVKEDF